MQLPQEFSVLASMIQWLLRMIQHIALSLSSNLPNKLRMEK
jgi:hypothetical protein